MTFKVTQLTAKEINSSSYEKRKNVTLPPKRGQIKARIFRSLAKTVLSMTSMAKRGKPEGEATSSSSAATPPSSSYNSDGQV